MKKQILSSVLLSLILTAATVWAEPTPETIVTLTASLGGQSGQVKVPYKVLKHSDVMRGMFAHRMFESVKLENQEPIDLDLILGIVIENLEELGLKFLMLTQDWLDEIVTTLKRIDQQKEESIPECLQGLTLNQTDFCPNNVFTLLLIGDLLGISDLVREASKLLSKNILKVDSNILFGLMLLNIDTFSKILTEEILKQNHDLFFPVTIDEEFLMLFPNECKIYWPRSVCAPDDKFLLIANGDKDVYMYSCTKTLDGSRILLAELKGHSDAVRRASVSQDGSLIITGSDDKTARIWKQQENGQWHCASILEGHDAFVCDVGFNEDGKLIKTIPKGGNPILWAQDGNDVWRQVAILKTSYEEIDCINFLSIGERDFGLFISMYKTPEAGRVWDLSFVTKPTFHQALFFVLSEQHQNGFQNLNEYEEFMLCQVWQSFHPSIQQHLKNKFKQINFDQFN